MAEQKESSVLFSLKELMNLEEDRIRQEEDDKQRKADAEMQARLESERRAREAEEARIREEDQRRRAEEQRSREEQARLEAMRQAEVERARVEAENAARIQAMQAQQEHERQLTHIKESQGKKKATFIAMGVGAVALIGIIGGGVALKVQSDKQALADAQHKSELAEQQAKLDKAMRDLAEQNEAVKSLEGAVANAKTDAEKKAAEAALLAAKEEQKKKAGTVSSFKGPAGPGVSPGVKPAKPCNCQPGDPLCSCL